MMGIVKHDDRQTSEGTLKFGFYEISDEFVFDTLCVLSLPSLCLFHHNNDQWIK